MSHPPSTVVAVVATKGGAGKTTSAVGLVSRLNALEPDSARLIDTDPQRTAETWLPHWSTAVRATSATQVRQLAVAPITLVDTPPGASDGSIAAMEAADLIVAVTALGPGDLDGIAHLCRLVEPHLVIPTQYDRRRALHGKSLEILSRRFGSQLTMPVPLAASVERAQAANTSISDSTPPGIAYADAASRLLALIASRREHHKMS